AHLVARLLVCLAAGGLQQAVAAKQETIADPVVAEAARLSRIAGVAAAVHVVAAVQVARKGKAVEALPEALSCRSSILTSPGISGLVSRMLLKTPCRTDCVL